MKKVRGFIESLADMLTPFITTTWYFDTKQVLRVIDTMMSPQDKLDFFCDIREVDLSQTYKGMFYGVQRYFMKIDIPLPETGFRQLCQKN